MSTTAPVDAATLRAEHSRLRAVALIAPLVIGAIATVLLLVMIPVLPDTIATHWNAAGEPNGFGSPWLNVALLVACIGIFTAFMASIVLHAHSTGSAPAALRFTAVFPPVFATLMSGVIVGSVAMQLGDTDPTDATGIGWVMLATFVASAVVGVIAWMLLPNRRSVPTPPMPATPSPIQPGERVMWTRVVTAPGALAVLPIVLVVAALVPVVIDPALWWIALLLLVIDVLLSLSLVMRVTVDDRGLRVVALLGVPVVRLGLESIASASVVEVDPVAEFGGWGPWRIDGTGRRGIVLRRGPGLQVERTHAQPIVVTVDDARTAAALLEGLVERHRAG